MIENDMTAAETTVNDILNNLTGTSEEARAKRALKKYALAAGVSVAAMVYAIRVADRYAYEPPTED